jgi:hypothetical protein
MKRFLLLLLSLHGLTLLGGCGGGSQRSFPPLTITTAASLSNGSAQLVYSQTIRVSSAA